jgi:ubiquinone biosynthesis protein UbiJ
MEATNSAKGSGSATDMREEINELKKAIEMLTEKLDKKEGK